MSDRRIRSAARFDDEVSEIESDRRRTPGGSPGASHARTMREAAFAPTARIASCEIDETAGAAIIVAIPHTPMSAAGRSPRKDAP